MGLEVLNKKIQVERDEFDGSENFLNISNLIIPFSIIFKKQNPPDIYSGQENLTFEEKNSKFQQILISEFISD
ncbi:MAG: hypothetical protein ACFE9S_06530 [Candidatus Hermodarchaeota archaeon]